MTPQSVRCSSSSEESCGHFHDQCNYHRLDSLGGKSTFVTIVTTVTMSSVVIMLVSFCIWMILSSTQPADSRASAS
ncbi:hypothetical protein WISP_03769 [Willisornis vidua]|uniref:Uncharacterized protein n=1 Tax=Willisornis vidua TaxID=1566151 RepID=A0ABQ9DTJ7_9PASS|nr:hypothetical protein WISP_03769 [Willisornis vidua]